MGRPGNHSRHSDRRNDWRDDRRGWREEEGDDWQNDRRRKGGKKGRQAQEPWREDEDERQNGYQDSGRGKSAAGAERRVHPSDKSKKAYTWEEFIGFSNGNRAQAARLWKESMPAQEPRREGGRGGGGKPQAKPPAKEQAGGGEDRSGRRFHPSDILKTPYTWEEFIEINDGDEEQAELMWSESEVVQDEDADGGDEQGVDGVEDMEDPMDPFGTGGLPAATEEEEGGADGNEDVENPMDPFEGDNPLSTNEEEPVLDAGDAPEEEQAPKRQRTELPRPMQPVSQSSWDASSRQAAASSHGAYQEVSEEFPEDRRFKGVFKSVGPNFSFIKSEELRTEYGVTRDVYVNPANVPDGSFARMPVSFTVVFTSKGAPQGQELILEPMVEADDVDDMGPVPDEESQASKRKRAGSGSAASAEANGETYVRLERVPLDYTHDVIIELMESLGMDASGLVETVVDKSAKYCTRTTCSVVCKFSSMAKAIEARDALHDQPCEDEVGTVWNLVATVQEPGMDNKAARRAAKKMRKGEGLPVPPPPGPPPPGPYGWWPWPPSPMYFAPPHMARRPPEPKAKAKAEPKSRGVFYASKGFVKPGAAKQGEKQGEKPAEAAQLDSPSAPGAAGSSEDAVPSPELREFGEIWGVDEETLKWIAGQPKNVQAELIEKFDPDVNQEQDIDLVDQVRNRVEALLRDQDINTKEARPAGPRPKEGIKVGQFVPAKVDSWDEVKGGFVILEDGGFKVMVPPGAVPDKSIMYDGGTVMVKLEWDNAKRRYKSVKCLSTEQALEGDEEEVGEPAVELTGNLDLDILEFFTHFKLEEATRKWFGDFPAEVQEMVLKRFKTDLSPGDFGLDPQFRALVQKVHSGQKPPGEVAPVVSDQLKYFAELWEIERVSIEWLARLDHEVQRLVTEEFVGMEESSLVSNAATATTTVNDNLFVTGLPHGTDSIKVRKLFGQFGIVTACRLFPPAQRGPVSATVRMSTPDQARIAVEDLHGVDALVSGQKLAVRYADAMVDDESEKKMEPRTTLPEDEQLTGRIKIWKEATGYGYIQVDGGGPDVYIIASAVFGLERPLKIGTHVSFKARWSEEKGQYYTEKCSGRSVALDPADEYRMILGRSVRNFARNLMKREELKKSGGSSRPVLMKTPGGLRPASGVFIVPAVKRDGSAPTPGSTKPKIVVSKPNGPQHIRPAGASQQPGAPVKFVLKLPAGVVPPNMNQEEQIPEEPPALDWLQQEQEQFPHEQFQQGQLQQQQAWEDQSWEGW